VARILEGGFVSMSIKLDHHHRLTVQKIFGHPINHNIQWHDVICLMERCGPVHESHRGNWTVMIDSEFQMIGRARGRDLTDDEVVRVRHLLSALGVTPSGSVAA
jgi:hypothetical protein